MYIPLHPELSTQTDKLRLPMFREYHQRDALEEAPEERDIRQGALAVQVEVSKNADDGLLVEKGDSLGSRSAKVEVEYSCQDVL